MHNKTKTNLFIHLLNHPILLVTLRDNSTLKRKHLLTRIQISIAITHKLNNNNYNKINNSQITKLTSNISKMIKTNLKMLMII